MLADADIEAVVPVSDLQAALRFYVDTLGLSVLELVGDRDGGREARLGAAGGSLTIYESEAAGGSRATVAAFLVEDLDEALVKLRAQGIAPIDYDLPHLRTKRGVATIGRTRVAWIADPDANVLAINTVGSPR